MGAGWAVDVNKWLWWWQPAMWLQSYKNRGHEHTILNATLWAHVWYLTCRLCWLIHHTERSLHVTCWMYNIEIKLLLGSRRQKYPGFTDFVTEYSHCWQRIWHGTICLSLQVVPKPANTGLDPTENSHPLTTPHLAAVTHPLPSFSFADTVLEVGAGTVLTRDARRIFALLICHFLMPHTADQQVKFQAISTNIPCAWLNCTQTWVCS